jgi:hypothetical protein
MRIQIASDLHLEAREKQTFETLLEPVAPILALLGDVAPLWHPNLRSFLEWCSERWETVLWIAGDLELGGEDIATATEFMRRLAGTYLNIQVLEKESLVSSDGLYVLGLSYSPPPRKGSMIWCPAKMQYVVAEPDRLPPKQQLDQYHTDFQWLRRTADAQKEPIVVLSYRGPTVWLQEERFIGDPDNTIVYPEMEQLLRPPIVAWLCGHTHSSIQFQKEWNGIGGGKGSILLATNPRGRPFENLDYRRDAVIRIDPRLYQI